MMSFNNYVSSAVTFAGFCRRVINLDWPYFIACLKILKLCRTVARQLYIWDYLVHFFLIWSNT